MIQLCSVVIDNYIIFLPIKSHTVTVLTNIDSCYPKLTLIYHNHKCELGGPSCTA